MTEDSPPSSEPQTHRGFAALLLAMTRNCLSLWIGGAVLFVWVGIREVRNTTFSSSIRDELVLTRFPAYYLFGAGCLITALVTHAAWGFAQFENRGKWRIGLAGIIAALCLMGIDYWTIYTPLTEMITPPGKPRTLDFISQHTASMWINFVGLAICVFTSLIVHWPERRPSKN